MPATESSRSTEDLFAGFTEGLAICRAAQEAVSTVGEASTTVTKSQVAFRRRRGFAYVWRPGQYFDSDIPAVLSIALPREVASTRFKEVAHPSTHVWMHRIELHKASELDDQVLGWLAEAYASAS
ncbi:DUF5655 domain-containing protein [Leucobacter sp. Z1108]|uniref:DUF5655 domain-containing protein n=1 Tax=Leucobacter sp. Z1108 TaxID=3439066 RepID=UPI003F36DACD